MSAKLSNNGFSELLKLIPSKSLSVDHIRSKDKDFFHYCGEEKIMAMLDPAIEKCRTAILRGSFPADKVSREMLLDEIWRMLSEEFKLERKRLASLENVINATGIVIHTNLGRAPQIAAEENNGGYCNLEFNLEDGSRGKRDGHFSELIRIVTGAEDAIAVNNNAAALLLISQSLCKNMEIIIARGEAVEIGEGFRIFEMLKAGGARIVEAGATNSVTEDDYENAVTPETAMIAKIHSANFKLTGFVKRVDERMLPAICRKYGIISYHDCGSGLLNRDLIKNRELVKNEPAVRELIDAGFDLVSFSGDKFLGSVQCGIICGKKAVIAKMRKNQIYRALRVSKNIISALSRTLIEYALGDPSKTVPVLAMLNAKNEDILKKCKKFMELVSASPEYKKIVDNQNLLSVSVITAKAAAGGGTTPEEFIESYAVAVAGGEGAAQKTDLEYISSFMRRSTNHVIGYIDSDRYLLNFRTVSENEIEIAADSFIGLLKDVSRR